MGSKKDRCMRFTIRGEDSDKTMDFEICFDKGGKFKKGRKIGGK
jgi:hypothetical protein